MCAHHLSLSGQAPDVLPWVEAVPRGKTGESSRASRSAPVRSHGDRTEIITTQRWYFRVVIVGIHGHRQHVVDLGCDDPCAGDNAPTWSPDGQHLLFQRVMGPFTSDGDAVFAALLMAARE